MQTEVTVCAVAGSPTPYSTSSSVRTDPRPREPGRHSSAVAPGPPAPSPGDCAYLRQDALAVRLAEMVVKGQLQAALQLLHSPFLLEPRPAWRRRGWGRGENKEKRGHELPPKAWSILGICVG